MKRVSGTPYTVPFIRFHPACSDYDRYEFDLDRLHLVRGPPSGEFWAGLRKRYEPWRDEDWIKFRDGKVFVTLEYYFPLGPGDAKLGGEFEENAFHASQDIAYEIYQRRLMEGRFEGVDMSPYMATRGPMTRRLREPVLMNYDECGFMEELILEGGRFAK
jgi:hypothetical protein